MKKLSALIRGGFLHILMGNILNKMIAMVSGVVIARLVDKAQYASLSYADNIYSYITLISGLGLSSAILKHCAVQNEKAIDKSYMRIAFRRGGMFEMLSSLLACLAVSFANVPYPQSRVYMWALLLYPTLSYANTCVICYMRTQLENRRYAWAGVIHSVSTCALSIAFVLAAGTYGVVYARYAAIGLTLMYSYGYYQRTVKGAHAVKLTPKERKTFISTGAALMVANLFSGIMPLNEAFLVNHVIADEVVTANFRVAGQFPQLLFLISGAITVYYFPIVAQMKEYAAIKRTVIKIGVVNGLLIAAIAAVGMLLTPLAFDMLYAGKYNDAVPISYRLWITRAARCCLLSVPMNMLPAIGKTAFNAFVSAGSCAAQVVVAYFFVTHVGVLGVSYGATMVYLLSAILYWGFFLRVCNQGAKQAGKQEEG